MTTEKDKLTSPLCLPDLPLPTPPPMANIMMTSRFDLNTRGGLGYRKILSSRSTEFRSPILGRSPIFLQNRPSIIKNEPLVRQYETVTDNLGLSSLPRHKNFEDLSKRLEDFDEYRNKMPPKSKYFSRDSVLSQELEEVNNLSHDLNYKFDAYQPHQQEISPEYQTVFYNEHYMSDIDENEEIKQFAIGYKTPERRYSDNSDKIIQNTNDRNMYSNTNNYNTMPSLSSLRYFKSGQTYGSTSSIKSSDIYATSPMLTRKFENFEQCDRVFKHPQRPVVKEAKIR
ncbi:unnamed protein product [Brassicogethes aeneus]|uniref:Uncharacterized protein n=1 Tax=Brassicogethes aeneus TaxID=1431903 RepID=A0A9P0AZK3_BRAAE|nr:unnamed protein product [Brassicogethes aeneus]